MAYFSNGTEGCLYEEQFCSRCVNWRDKGDGCGVGCAIWDAHQLYAYEECNNDGKDGRPLTNAKAILDTLIPMSEEGFAEECACFVEKS